MTTCTKFANVLYRRQILRETRQDLPFNFFLSSFTFYSIRHLLFDIDLNFRLRYPAFFFLQIHILSTVLQSHFSFFIVSLLKLAFLLFHSFFITLYLISLYPFLCVCVILCIVCRPMFNKPFIKFLPWALLYYRLLLNSNRRNIFYEIGFQIGNYL